MSDILTVEKKKIEKLQFELMTRLPFDIKMVSSSFINYDSKIINDY